MPRAQATGGEIRQVLLETISAYSEAQRSIQTRSLLWDVSKKIKEQGKNVPDQALLTVFHDLMRTGFLAWGQDLSNIEPPFMHVTAKGRKSLEHLSRDPANPDGYLAALAPHLGKNTIAWSYAKEALDTFNNDCYKASAVMIGAASEALILDLRDVLVTKMADLNQQAPRGLTGWQVKTVRDNIKTALEAKRRDMDRGLRERFEGFWSALTDSARRIRNDAGHPKSVDPVTPEVVHATLLLFHEIAHLVADLKAWIKNNYSC